MKEISFWQVEWLLQGLEIEQKAHHHVKSIIKTAASDSRDIALKSAGKAYKSAFFREKSVLSGVYYMEQYQNIRGVKLSFLKSSTHLLCVQRFLKQYF